MISAFMYYITDTHTYIYIFIDFEYMFPPFLLKNLAVFIANNVSTARTKEKIFYLNKAEDRVSPL